MGMIENPEREILLKLLRAEAVPEVSAEQWLKILQLSRQHKVEAILYRELKKQGLGEQVPPETWKTLREDYLHGANRNIRIYRELGKILSTFQQADIPVIPLKGAFLAEKIYGNIAVRPMGDVDLLVRKADLASTDENLQAMDFKRTQSSLEMFKGTRHFVYHSRQNGPMVEVHWDLIGSVYDITVDLDGIWERSQPAQLADRPVRAMSPEDQILHLCIHTSEQVFETGLCAICDLVETLRAYQERLNWEILRQRAIDWKALRAVYMNLRLAKELLNAPITGGWLETFKPIDFEPWYLTLAREHLFASMEGMETALPAKPLVGDFWSEKRWSHRLGLLWKRVFLSRKEMGYKYHLDSKSWKIFLYYPVRFKDLVAGFGGHLLALLRGNREIVSRAERQDQVNQLQHWLLSGDCRLEVR